LDKNFPTRRTFWSIPTAKIWRASQLPALLCTTPLENYIHSTKCTHSTGMQQLKRGHQTSQCGRGAYQARRYEAAAREPQTYQDQQHRCQEDQGRQRCVHEPDIGRSRPVTTSQTC